MTRGRRGSLALRRRALPSPPPRRFIPALSQNPLDAPPGSFCRCRKSLRVEPFRPPGVLVLQPSRARFLHLAGSNQGNCRSADMIISPVGPIPVARWSGDLQGSPPSDAIPESLVCVDADERAVAAGHSVDLRWLTGLDDLLGCVAARMSRVEPRLRLRRFILGMMAGLPSGHPHDPSVRTPHPRATPAQT